MSSVRAKTTALNSFGILFFFIFLKSPKLHFKENIKYQHKSNGLLAAESGLPAPALQIHSNIGDSTWEGQSSGRKEGI